MLLLAKKQKKVLYVGIRNKYCCICARAVSRNETAIDHVCFKNWTKASTGMEADIIVEGFKKSIALHGIKFGYLVGDGDSSVLKRLTEAQPYPDRVVQKIECRNHLLRNYCTRLRELGSRRISSSRKVVPVEERKLLTNSIKRLRNGIIAAITHVTYLSHLPHAEKVRLLRNDIHNGPSHVFGEHSNCAEYFCTKKDSGEENWVQRMKQSGLFQDIMYSTERMTRNAESLVLNMDNNAAELYNSLVAKFVGGKRINFSTRRSYGTRCEAAAISYNVPPRKFPRYVHKKLTKHSPGVYTKQIISSQEKRHQWKVTRKLVKPEKSKRKREYVPPDEDYGLPSEDLDLDKFEDEKKTFLQQLSVDIESIEKQSMGQSDSLFWKEERRKR